MTQPSKKTMIIQDGIEEVLRTGNFVAFAVETSQATIEIKRVNAVQLKQRDAILLAKVLIDQASEFLAAATGKPLEFTLGG